MYNFLFFFDCLLLLLFVIRLFINTLNSIYHRDFNGIPIVPLNERVIGGIYFFDHRFDDFPAIRRIITHEVLKRICEFKAETKRFNVLAYPAVRIHKF